MRVSINASNEIINFLWGAGHDDRPLGANEVLVTGYSFDTDQYHSGDRINDKELNGVKRYTIDGAGVVHRRTDAEIEALPEYVENTAVTRYQQYIKLMSERRALLDGIAHPQAPAVLVTRSQARLDIVNQALLDLIATL